MKMQHKLFQQRITYGVSSIQGARPYQEDRYTIISNLGNSNYFYAGIFDGHGGSGAVEYAATNLHLQLEKLLVRNDPSEALKLAFIATDLDIHNLNISSGTTASVVLVKDNHVFIANVGDSTVFIKKRTESIHQLTHNHHLTDPVELNQYRSSKWFTEKSRLISQGKVKGFKLIAVSRSLGDQFFEDAISPIPDLSETDLDNGDTIILATDGLWNFVDITQLESENPQVLSELLIQEALINKSKDNITVVALKT